MHHLVNDPGMEKEVPRDADNSELPNICSIRIPADKERLRSQLTQLLSAHPWQAEIEESFLAKMGIAKPPAT